RSGSARALRSRSRHLLDVQDFHATALGLDLRLAGLAHGVDPHGRRVPDLDAAEHLDEPALAVLDQPRLHEALGVDHGVGGERAQRLQIHDRVVLAAAVRQEAALGQPPVQRHLPALEAAVLAAAGARVVALVALGRGLAVTRPRAAADTLALLRGAGRRTQVTELHGSPAARAPRPRPYRGSSACRRARRTGACGAGRGPSPSPPAWGTDRSGTSSA